MRDTLKDAVDFVVIGGMSQQRKVAVPIIVLFIVNQFAAAVYFGIRYGLGAGLLVVEISGVGWLGALAFIAIVYGLLIRLAFTRRPIRRR